MKKINFSIRINAPKEKVWKIMLDDATYRQWAVPFSPGSHFVGDWSEGSEIKFLGPDQSGMYSVIRKNIPHDFISIEHLGFIKGEIKDNTSKEARQWTPAFENYTFTDTEGGTELGIEIDIADEYITTFQELWPQALHILKELSEK